MELLISLFIFLCVAAIVYYIITLIIRQLPIPAPFGNIILVIVLLIILIYFLQRYVAPLLGVSIR